MFVLYLFYANRGTQKLAKMKTQITNPFVSTLGTTFSGCEFPKGQELLELNGKYFWKTAYNRMIEVSEKQNFDDFGNVSYSITFNS